MEAPLWHTPWYHFGVYSMVYSTWMCYYECRMGYYECRHLHVFLCMWAHLHMCVAKQVAMLVVLACVHARTNPLKSTFHTPIACVHAVHTWSGAFELWWDPPLLVLLSTSCSLLLGRLRELIKLKGIAGVPTRRRRFWVAACKLREF